MKVGLHTVDLFPGRERLMPFRTVLEVAKVMKAHGWEADVLNEVSQSRMHRIWIGKVSRFCNALVILVNLVNG